MTHDSRLSGRRPMPPGVTYFDGPRLRRALLAACRHVRSFQAELNRINVFPVPDGDAGTNIVLTAQSVAEGIRGSRTRRADAVATEAAKSAILGARGNCGMLFSHFLVGFAAGLEGRERASTDDFFRALLEDVRTMEQGLDNPVEGTILTVVRDTAQAPREENQWDFAQLLPALVEAARKSLERTPRLLPVLARAKVVDAGGKGFVEMLDGAARLLSGKLKMEEADSGPGIGSAPAADLLTRLEDFLGKGDVLAGKTGQPDASPIATLGREHLTGVRRYCTEILVQGSAIPDEEEIRAGLREGTEDLLVLAAGDLLKVHLHTDDPSGAVEFLRGLGTVVAHKSEDMFAQYDAAVRARSGRVRRPTGIVIDSAADLPPTVRRSHGIHTVPIFLNFEDRTLRDGIDIDAMAIHERIATDQPLPTTSPPPPGEFARAFQAASNDYESLVVIPMASAMGGVYRSARSASTLVPGIDLHLFDSRAASLLHGLLALKGAELAEDGTDPADIVRELDRIRDRSGMLFTVRNLSRLRASGRISSFKGWLGGLLNLKPVFCLNRQGAIEAVARARGAEAAQAAVFKQIESQIPSDTARVRFGVTHVGDQAVAAKLRDELLARFGRTEIMVAPAAATVSLHTGTGAWGIAYMVED